MNIKKGLDFTLSENFSVEQHTNNITKEAKKCASWIFHLFDSRGRQNILLLFTLKDALGF